MRYILGALASAGVLFVLIASWAVWEVGLASHDLRLESGKLTVQVATDSQVLTDKFASVADQLVATLAAINAPCVPHKACGTLADVNRTLATVRGTVGAVEVAARHEDKNLTALDAQELVLFNDVHNTMQLAQGTISKVDTTLDTVAPMLDASTAILHHIDDRVSDQQIIQLVSHLNGMSTSGDKMLAEGQQKEHELLHPDKKKLTRLGVVSAVVLWIHSHVTPSLF